MKGGWQVSEIILPNGEVATSSERPKAVIGKRLKPTIDLAHMQGMQLWLRNAPDDKKFPITPGGYVGLINGPIARPEYPKRAQAVQVLSYFQPGVAVGLPCELLEVSDPWACTPGVDQWVSLLE